MKNMLPTFYYDRVCESFVIDVFFLELGSTRSDN